MVAGRPIEVQKSSVAGDVEAHSPAQLRRASSPYISLQTASIHNREWEENMEITVSDIREMSQTAAPRIADGIVANQQVISQLA